jgi:hypothetical protein
LNRFTTAFVMGAVGAKVRNRSLDVALDRLELPGLAIRSISPLDPSGWMRVNLVRTGPAIAREVEPARITGSTPATSSSMASGLR